MSLTVSYFQNALSFDKPVQCLLYTVEVQAQLAKFQVQNSQERMSGTIVFPERDTRFVRLFCKNVSYIVRGGLTNL